MASQNQLSAMLEDILTAARVQRWELDRCDEGGEGGYVVGYDPGSEGPRYDTMETGDAQVGKLSCVRTRRSTREIGKDHEQVAPPGRTPSVSPK